MTENEAMDLDKLIADAKSLAKEKDTLARTFRGFKDYGNPKSTITSGAEKAQKEAEQYESVAKLFEELKQYRAIGTVEEFKELKEKEERFDRNIKMFNKIGLEIRVKAIDEFADKICEKYTEEERNRNYRWYSAQIKQNIADIAEQLKG